MRTHLSQAGSQSEGFWEDPDSLWPGIVLWLLKEPCAHVWCLHYPLLRQGFCLSLSLPWFFSWDVLKRQRLAIYPVSVVTSNRGLVVNSSTGVHLSLASGNAHSRLTDCKGPTWSPVYLLPQKNPAGPSWVQLFPLLVCRKSFSLLGLLPVPKSNFMQRSETRQNQEKQSNKTKW